MFLWCNADNLNKIKEERKNMASNKIKCGIECLDLMFDGLMRGSSYIIAAGRGIGKTTFLLATAKHFATLDKTLYITIEQNTYQLEPYLQQNDNLAIYEMDKLDQWAEIEQIIALEQIKYVVFDYIGAILGDNDSTWLTLLNQANYIAEIAKKYNIIFVTACQADDLLFQEFVNNKDSNMLFTGRYVSFSKHIVDKVAGAAYLIKDKDDNVYLYNFKNRYAMLQSQPIKVNNLDFNSKAWLNYARNHLERRW